MAGSTSRVRAVATRSPLAIATAIGPQKELVMRGIIPNIAAAAVSIIGLKRRIADSPIASHGVYPALICCCIWSISMTAFIIIIPAIANTPRMATNPIA